MKAIVRYPVRHVKDIDSLPDVEVREKTFEFNKKETAFFTAGYEKACEDKEFNWRDSIRVIVI